MCVTWLIYVCAMTHSYVYSVYYMKWLRAELWQCLPGQCLAWSGSLLQCVAVCCSVLQCVAVCCCVLQCDEVCSSVLLCVVMCCNAYLIYHIKSLRVESWDFVTAVEFGAVPAGVKIILFLVQIIFHKRALNLGHFCGKWHIKIRDPISLLQILLQIQWQAGCYCSNSRLAMLQQAHVCVSRTQMCVSWTNVWVREHICVFWTHRCVSGDCRTDFCVSEVSSSVYIVVI